MFYNNRGAVGHVNGDVTLVVPPQNPLTTSWRSNAESYANSGRSMTRQDIADMNLFKDINGSRLAAFTLPQISALFSPPPTTTKIFKNNFP